ncbi:ParB/RepB/Spo0J family partition protein [Ideonella sp. 4Y16]|uniref:ParB/RepB/Spo0J family partition protein n=1 Tax=Ideonella alba TaxID=2824118 RepID=A0A940YPN7_9BURK|nr:ParB/RepB/Spo0J family partition protein [Ideonella alba]MBQ0933569.1 ParB/RepB/Spo0J family partition protein [Ideonella alba]MBQ0946201.1 ParB/RepB/Spo0J family partition protein [Ideonella alba]
MKLKKEWLLIKVEDLVPSPYNVRRHSAGQVEELAALIASQGLLQNLVVTPQQVGRGKRRQCKFGVVAGERRRRALVLLQARGVLSAGHEVLCECVGAEHAQEISLAENRGREPMHPADEFEAFQALVAQGRGVEDVAARFGVSPMVVQRRLKLAALSPRLLALYREDGINLDQLMALCLSGEHAAQERAWFEAQPWERTPAALRKRLTVGEVLAHQSALARFVGLDAYEAAGGAVRRDLFDSDNSCWICDQDLLRRLASDKLDAQAQALRGEGWAWVEARIELDPAALRSFSRCEPSVRAPSADEKRALAELDQRAAELNAEQQMLDDQDTWTPADGERIELEQQDIEVRRKAIQVARQAWRDEDKARSGVIVTVGRDGAAELVRGLVRAEDRKAGKSAGGGQARGRQAVEAGKGGAEEGGDTGVETGSSDFGTPTPATYSDTLLRRLAAHRTAALQAVLARDAKTPLVALTHALAVQVFERVGLQARSALQISARPPRHELLRAADDLPSSRAWAELEKRRAGWLQRLPQAEGDWLQQLADLPEPDLLDLLGLCAASLALVPTGLAGAAHGLEHLAGLDMRQWWEPTPEAFLNHVSKAQIAQAMREGEQSGAGNGEGDGSTVAASSVAGTNMKKGELASLAASRLVGKGWLPQPLKAAA